MSDVGPRTLSEYRESILKQQELWEKAKRQWPEYVSWSADAIGIIGVLAAAFISNPHTRLWYLLPLLAVAAALGLSSAILSEWRFRRTARYAYALGYLHLIVHIFRNQMVTVEKWTDQQVKDCLSEVLSAFAAAFTIITGAPCRACIKVVKIEPPPGKKMEDIPDEERIKHAYTRTFCRDSATMARIGNVQEGPLDAPVRDNTDFRFLFDDVRQRCYVANNLPKLGDMQYKNTSVDKHAKAGDKGWPLPYKATMVWPIRVVTEAAQFGQVFT